MEYVNYKKIHRINTRNTKITVVEWPGGGITLDKMGRIAKGVWSGGALGMTDRTARKVRAILNRIYGRKRASR